MYSVDEIEGFGEGKHRSIQMVYEVVLEPDDPDPSHSTASPSPDLVLDESGITWRAVAGILSTEISALGLAIFIGVYEKVIWLACFLCAPPLLKLIPLCINVRRETVAAWPRGGAESYKVFGFGKTEYGFIVIGGTEKEDKHESVVRQLFRHYGHPQRSEHAFFGDRFREILSKILVALFVFYVPAGLISLIWMDPQVQYIWLGYQVYTIIAMHFVRLFGGASAGRIEKRAAVILQSGRSVWLRGAGGHAVKATLAMTEVESVKSARGVDI